jgi:hypothetical protein
MKHGERRAVSLPGRDSEPFGRGLLMGAAIGAVLWVAIGAVVFWVAALVWKLWD